MRDNLIDVSDEIFGKYVSCTKYGGYYYADQDFTKGKGFGKPEIGSVSYEGHKFTYWDWVKSSIGAK